MSGATHRARKTHSDLCQRTFDSATEARRGEILHTLVTAGVITELDYQPVFVLSVAPKVTYRPDFRYRDEHGHLVYEDVKGGPISRELRVKLAWLRAQIGLEVDLVRADRRGGWTIERI